MVREQGPAARTKSKQAGTSDSIQDPVILHLQVYITKKIKEARKNVPRPDMSHFLLSNEIDAVIPHARPPLD